MILKKIVKRMAMIIIAVIVLITITAFFYVQQPQFGVAPSSKRLEGILQSPHYKDGAFQNLSRTSQLAEGYSYPKVMYEFFFKKKSNLKPTGEIPSIKTDLKSLPYAKDLLVWFGHSSYLLQLDGKKILVDPVLSGYASPSNLLNKAFNGSDTYKIADLPYIVVP